MATQSAHLLTTVAVDMQSNVVHATNGTIIANGAVQLLYDAATFRDKQQLCNAIYLIYQDMLESNGTATFTGTT